MTRIFTILWFALTIGWITMFCLNDSPIAFKVLVITLGIGIIITKCFLIKRYGE